MPADLAERADGAQIEAELAALGERVSQIVDALEQHPDPKVQEQVAELLEGLDRLHREALGRLTALLESRGMMDEACADPVIGATLGLYELLPPDPREEAEEALKAVRPYIESHGGEVEVVDVRDGLVAVRLRGACHGCPGAPLTLARAVEAAIRVRLPDLRGLEVAPSLAAVTPPPPAPSAIATVRPGSSVISLGDLQRTARPAPAPEAPRPEPPEWTEMCAVDDVPPGTMIAPGDTSVLVCNVDGEIFAYRNGCGRGPLALHVGGFHDGIIECTWHPGCVYDARTGESRSDPRVKRLTVYPVAVEEGVVRIAKNKGVPAPLFRLPSAQPAGAS